MDNAMASKGRRKERNTKNKNPSDEDRHRRHLPVGYQGGWHELCRHCRSYDEIAHSIGGGSH
eukprot:scaffold231442_cov24-Attheya_sp.AAC.1